LCEKSSSRTSKYRSPPSPTTGISPMTSMWTSCSLSVDSAAVEVGSGVLLCFPRRHASQ
jgi:hypothetical protein